MKRERLTTAQNGKVVSPYRQGVWSALELMFEMFFVVHVFAVIWFFILYKVDRGTIYASDESNISLLDFYFLSLRDAVLLFSASPPSHMVNRTEQPIVQTIVFLRPVGALVEAVIFARVVLIEQRMMILKSKTHEQQCAINSAIEQLNLPENLHRRINMYHQFLQIQHDKLV